MTAPENIKRFRYAHTVRVYLKALTREQMRAYVDCEAAVPFCCSKCEGWGDNVWYDKHGDEHCEWGGCSLCDGTGELPSSELSVDDVRV